jgi:hypothetical protein
LAARRRDRKCYVVTDVVKPPQQRADIDLAGKRPKAGDDGAERGRTDAQHMIGETRAQRGIAPGAGDPGKGPSRALRFVVVVG